MPDNFLTSVEGNRFLDTGVNYHIITLRKLDKNNLKKITTNTSLHPLETNAA